MEKSKQPMLCPLCVRSVTWIEKQSQLALAEVITCGALTSKAFCVRAAAVK